MRLKRAADEEAGFSRLLEIDNPGSKSTMMGRSNIWSTHIWPQSKLNVDTPKTLPHKISSVLSITGNYPNKSEVAIELVTVLL